MIPKKEGSDVDLNAKIDEDLTKAQKQQSEIIKNKPKLAQAIGSKYFKYIILLCTAGVIGYKFLFAPTPEEPKKKKTSKNRVAKSSNNKNAQQQSMAKSGVGKITNAEVSKEKPDAKQIISLEAQTMSNSEILSDVAVPKLSIPEVPKLPTIDKLTIKDEKKVILVDDQRTSKDASNSLTDKMTGKTPDISKDNILSSVAQYPDLPSTPSVGANVGNSKNDKKKTRKIKKKVKDTNGKTKTVEVEVEIDDHGNIMREVAPDVGTTAVSSSVLSPNTPLSEQLEQNNNYDNSDVSKQPAGSAKKKGISSSIGTKTLNEMFVLSGKGTTTLKSKSASGSSKKDFILFDGSSISEKEIISTEQSSNVNKISNLENTILAGKVMEAVLETAINSEAAGTIRAVMSRDVFGESGNKILIPRGSRLYGSYATTSTTTQTRLLLTWTKVIRPDGVVISMNADTYDQSGRKGIEGDIDTRYGEMFKNSLLYSFVTLGTAIAIEKIAGIKGSTSIVAGNGTSVTQSSPANAAATSVLETAQDIAEKMTDGLTDDLNPVISIPQGMLLKIIASTDIVIESAYKRRTSDIKLD